MSTPNGSLTPYCTADRFLRRYDWRTVGDYLSDYDRKYTRLETLTVGTVPNVILMDLLGGSAGEIEAACLHADSYTVADLQALTGNAQLMLAHMNADLALPKLFGRRPDMTPPPLPVWVDQAQKMLASLWDGSRIFALQEHADAGLPSHDIEDPRTAQNRMLPSTIMRRHFGARTKDIRQFPGGSF
jgi:hypothetical protein